MAAITTAQAARLYKRSAVWRMLKQKYGDGFYLFLENFDATTGALVTVAGEDLTGTTAAAFKVYSANVTDVKLNMAINTSADGNYILTLQPASGTWAANRTVSIPDPGGSDTFVMAALAQTLTNKTLTAPTIASFVNATHDHSSAEQGGTLGSSDMDGTTQNTFDIDSDNTTGILRLQTTTGGTNSTVTVTNTTTAADVTITLPAVTGTVGLINVAQTGYISLAGSVSGGIKIAPIATGTALTTIQNQNVAAATITLPSATATLAGLGLANTWSAANAFAAITTTGITGTDASLGIAGTAGAGAGAGGIVAIVGGLGHTAAAGGAVTVTGGAGADTGAGAAVTLVGGGSGAGLTGNGGAFSATGGAALSTAGNGGAASIIGGVATTTGTGGAITITSGASAGASGTAGAVAIDAGAAASGTAGAITIGTTNAASVGIGNATTVTTINGTAVVSETDTGTATVTDVLTLKHIGGTVAAGFGTGISIWTEDLGSAAGEEQAAMDFSLATATNGAEDCDFILSLNLAGTITQAFKIDSVNQTAIIGVASDADSIKSLQIFP
ncbi:MAG TPA: hypothetical protein VM238_03540, partial [Phycisphaerae bacterium]|nr:hypothetical protein [Phycisphaerae bacterium]